MEKEKRRQELLNLLKQKVESLEDVAHHKDWSRELDDLDLELGYKSREQLRRENGVFYGCKVKVHYQ